jgi:hypothetical protein
MIFLRLASAEVQEDDDETADWALTIDSRSSRSHVALLGYEPLR